MKYIVKTYRLLNVNLTSDICEFDTEIEAKNYADYCNNTDLEAINPLDQSKSYFYDYDYQL